jgi:hypothetical protein
LVLSHAGLLASNRLVHAALPSLVDEILDNRWVDAVHVDVEADVVLPDRRDDVSTLPRPPLPRPLADDAQRCRHAFRGQQVGDRFGDLVGLR